MKKILYILSSLLIAVLVVSCNQDMEIEGDQGYLSLSINSLTSTHTPGETRSNVPADYDAKTLHVEILDENGVVVKSTDNFAEDEESTDEYEDIFSDSGSSEGFRFTAEDF